MAFKPLIAPSILSADFSHLREQIAEAAMEVGGQVFVATRQPSKQIGFQ